MTFKLVTSFIISLLSVSFKSVKLFAIKSFTSSIVKETKSFLVTNSVKLSRRLLKTELDLIFFFKLSANVFLPVLIASWVAYLLAVTSIILFVTASLMSTPDCVNMLLKISLINFFVSWGAEDSPKLLTAWVRSFIKSLVNNFLSDKYFNKLPSVSTLSAKKLIALLNFLK